MERESPLSELFRALWGLEKLQGKLKLERNGEGEEGDEDDEDISDLSEVVQLQKGQCGCGR